MTILTETEAREAVWERMHEWRRAVAAAAIPLDQHTPAIGERITAASQSLDAALDRYRDAILASQPCSNYYVMELQADNCFDIGEYSETDKWPPPNAYTPCSTCEARRRLEG